MARNLSDIEESAPASPTQAISSDSYTKNLIPTLPTREGWATPLTLYKNYWLRTHMVKNFMLVQEDFKPRCGDIILATQPKCGTTWLKALTFAITKRSQYTFAEHPLLKCHPQHIVPNIGTAPRGELPYIETLPSPRLLATHLPLSLLPTTMAGSGCQIVYLSREPKDAFVSRWHFENRITTRVPIKMDDALTMFCDGFSPFGPFWDHYLEYWRESLARPQEVLFLKYEDIMSEPVKVVKKLASFLGVPFTVEEEKSGVPEEVVRLCSFESLSNLEVNTTGGVQRGEGRLFIEYSSLFRKGKVGDWVNHLSAEMEEKLNRIVEEKLKGSGLLF